jgi:hypothetical protein
MCFLGVVRRVKKLLAREQRVEHRGSLEEFEGLKGASDTNWVAELDNRILVQELVAFMDSETRDLFFKWVRGDDWEEIAGGPRNQRQRGPAPPPLRNREVSRACLPTDKYETEAGACRTEVD